MIATPRRGRAVDCWLLAPLCLALACSDVDDGGEAAGGEGGAGTDALPLPTPAIEAPFLRGELSCEEPWGGDAAERELSPAEETSPPAPAGLPELLADIRARGGRPQLHFDTSAAGRRLNVRVPVRTRDLERSADGSDGFALDLGALTVRLSHDPAAAAEGPLLVIPPTLPLDQVVVLKTYAREPAAGGGLGGARLTMVSVFDRRDERAGPVISLAIDEGVPQARGGDCDALAYELASEVPPVAVSFPRLTSCTLDECAKTRAAWLRANHDLYRVRQMLEFVAASPAEERPWLWEQQGGSERGERLMSYESDDVGPNTALAFYFGPYADYRLDAIRTAYGRLWRQFHDHDLGGLELDIECTPDGPGDICNTTKPGGHHAVKSNMKLCDKAYTTPSQAFDVPRLVLHESMHHMFIPWRDNVARLSPIMDTHTHGHGAVCAGKLVTDKGYGLTKIKHLATYENDRGDDCWHNNYAFRNNDTYAYAAATIGTYIRFGFLARWPLEQPPEYEDNFPDPECGTPGVHTPPPGFSDPLGKCYKSGGELVCPGAHGGLSPGDLDLAVICAAG